MIQDMDTIQFESKSEINDLIKILEKYIKAYPEEENNETIKEIYSILDIMQLTW